MAITTSSTPIVAEKVSVALAVQSGSIVEWDIITVPSQSSFAAGKMVNESGDDVNYWTPDASGEWVIRGTQYNVIAGRASYAGGPKSSDTKVMLSSETATIDVGEELTIPVFNDTGDGGILRVVVAGYSVVSAEITDHANPKSKAAALTSPVASALSDIEGYPVSTAGWDLVARTNELCVAYRAHSDSTSHHTVAASVASNANLTSTYLHNDPPENAPDCIFALNALKSRLQNHMRPSGGITTWHVSDDVASLQMAKNATDVPSAVALMATVADTYSQHIIAGTDALAVSQAFHSGGYSYTLNGTIGTTTITPRRISFTKTGAGTIGASAKASVTGLDWRGNSQVDLVTQGSFGTKYFSKVNDISTRADNTSSGASFVTFGTYGKVHSAADGTNAVTSAKPLDTIVSSYLNAISTFYPAPASTTNVGVIEASHRLGLGRKK